MVSGFPLEGKRITELGIDKNVKKIDAVFIWGYNKRTYLVRQFVFLYPRAHVVVCLFKCNTEEKTRKNLCIMGGNLFRVLNVGICKI